MGFFTKTKQDYISLSSSYPTDDFLNDDIAILFFKTQEFKYYYESIKRVNQKRNISLKLISIILPLFNKIDDSSTNSKIDNLVKSLLRIQKGKASNINEIAKNIHSTGYNLLEISIPITLENLKDSYKKARLKHHPSKVGEINNMRSINEAYTQFHKLACEERGTLTKTSNGDTAVGSNQKYIAHDSNEYFADIGMLLVNVCTDVMAVDIAFEVFHKIHTIEYLKNDKIKLRILSNIELLEKLSIRLKQASLISESEIVFKVVVEACQIAVKEGLNYNNFASLLRTKLNANKIAKPILNHFIQAENAFRLKMVDEYQYKKHLDIFNSEQLEKQNHQKILEEYALSHGFIKFLCFSQKDLLEKPIEFVPEPGYFDIRYEHLSDIQKAEYQHVFLTEVSINLIEKYLLVRFNSLLVKLIWEYKNIDTNRLLLECNVLQRAFPTENIEFYVLPSTIEYLSTLNDTERNSKLNLLRDLDSTRKEFNLEMAISINIDSGGIETEPSQSPIKPISPSNEYLNFIRAPIDKLDFFKKTGNFKTKEEQREDGVAWNRDLKAIEQLKNSEIGKAREKVIYESKVEPKMIIENLLPHIKAMLELGEKLTIKNTGELQIGYDINVLTTAYAKLKDWQNVKYWIQLFFNLPINYRDRSSNGEQEKLKKRLLKSEERNRQTR